MANKKQATFVVVLTALVVSGSSSAFAGEVILNPGETVTVPSGTKVIVKVPRTVVSAEPAAPAPAPAPVVAPTTSPVNGFITDEDFESQSSVDAPEDPTALVEVGARVGLTFAGPAFAGSVGASFRPAKRLVGNITAWLGQGDVEVPVPEPDQQVINADVERAWIFGVDTGVYYLMSRRLWLGGGASYSRSLTNLNRGDFAVAWSFGPQVRLQPNQDVFVNFMWGTGPHEKLDGGWEQRNEAHASVGLSF